MRRHDRCWGSDGGPRPSRAGVNLWQRRPSCESVTAPRPRGDEPQAVPDRPTLVDCAPHARGSTDERCQRPVNLLPGLTHTGVNRPPASRQPTVCPVLPRAGMIRSAGEARQPRPYPPRRGGSEPGRGAAKNEQRNNGPARAGMNQRTRGHAARPPAPPRASGDDSGACLPSHTAAASSHTRGGQPSVEPGDPPAPRAPPRRGCAASSTASALVRLRCLARAGVNRASQQHSTTSTTPPCCRGAKPGTAPAVHPAGCCAPPERG